jgi:hypothetical protein
MWQRPQADISVGFGPPNPKNPFDVKFIILDKEFPELSLTETVSINDAMNDESAISDWSNAMAAEFNSLQSKNTGMLVPPPSDNKVIGGMWLLTRKKNEFNQVVRHKARWVVFGNHQEYMLHYFETYSSIARNQSLKMMFLLAINNDYSVFQFDVEMVFLYGNIDANMFVSQVLGFEDLDPKKKTWVWKLQKSLYGTKQAPRMWKAHLIETLGNLRFLLCIIDDALFHNAHKSVLLHMHVDDGLVDGKSRQDVLHFIDLLKNFYVLKVKEQPNQHLGYTLDWLRKRLLYVHQSNFPQKILEEFDMTNANAVKAPSSLNFHWVIALESPPFDIETMQKAVGMLNYLALHTRPDLAFTINVLAQFASNPTLTHWAMIKHVPRYLVGSINIGVEFSKSSNLGAVLNDWADADYGTSLVSKKPMLGYVICFYGNPISCTTKKQPVVAQSKTEAELIAIKKCAKQLRWMSNFIILLDIKIDIPIIYNDNSGAVIISKDAQPNPNTKHIEI